MLLRRFLSLSLVLICLTAIAFIEAMAQQAMSAPSDAEIRIDQKYDDAVNAWSRGAYVKAKSLLNYIIKNWSKDYTTPSFAQVEITYAQVLKKSGQESEAAKIEKQYASAIAAEEKQLKALEEEAKRKTESARGDDLNYTSERAWLSQKRHQLGKLYFAEGKYAEAETLLKAAFNDQATVYGRGSSDAKIIAGDYETLLRATGRKTDAGRAMVAIPSDVGHPPVKLDLPANPQLKKLGADKLVIVLEDEYKAPSMGCWMTKTAWLEGIKNETTLWKKPIHLTECVNMNTAGVDTKGTYITVWFTPPNGGTKKFGQRFLWDGSKVRYIGGH
jgi:tetratricopeptide (TPR) repeat protein